MITDKRTNISEFRLSSHYIPFNSTLISASSHSEETRLSERGAPGVGDQPIVYIVLGSPAYDFDGMSSNKFSGGIVIDSRFVLIKVLVNFVGGSDWAVVIDFRLDGSNGLVKAVSGGSWKRQIASEQAVFAETC